MKKTYSVKLGSGKVLEVKANSIQEVEVLVAYDMPEEYFGMSITCKDAQEYLGIPVRSFFEEEAELMGKEVPNPMEMAIQGVRYATGCYKTVYDKDGDECNFHITLREAMDRGIIK